MTKEEIKTEIANLEAEAKQMLANANFITGAITAFRKVVASLESKEKTMVNDVKDDVAKDLITEANKLESVKSQQE